MADSIMPDDALDRATRSKIVACALAVDAKDEVAVDFCRWP